MTIRPDTWSRRQAERFLAHVLDREDRLLSELATWMRATGGPIEKMDASVASLVDYWGWFIDFADQGAPGVPAEAKPSMWAPSDRPVGVGWYEQVWPLRYAAQAGEHYLRLVANRLTPPADWTIYVDKKLGSVNQEQYSPAITRHNTYDMTVWETMLNLSSKIRAEPAQSLYIFQWDIDDARRSQRLHKAFVTKWHDLIPEQECTTSVLVDLPDTPTRGPFPTREQILGPSGDV